MTIMNYRDGDIVLFADTGREHPKTYKFINDFEAFEKIPVIRISYEGGFRGMLEHNKWKHLPNRVKRSCTLELKIKTSKRWLRANYGKQNYEWLVGFRADEERRVKSYEQRQAYIHPVFPLFEQGIDKAYVNEYWSKKPYTLEIPSILGNCTLCFLKGKNAIINIMRSYPELANEWIEDEELSKANGGGYTYFQDTTYKHLLMMAQSDLFKGQDLTNLNQAYNCSCTS